MRGERPSHEPVPPLPGGSSPHARGTHDLAWRGQHVVRFIPACAGNAPAPRATAESPSVHPRMRGERLFGSTDSIRWFGSSPHARGTLPHHQLAQRDERFIPACAGNAGDQYHFFSTISVHPRMRGERQGRGGFQKREAGSSPHARGTLCRKAFTASMLRFIPACAGNASAASVSLATSSVHPRMRGERMRFSLPRRLDTGSSPHARGTR